MSHSTPEDRGSTRQASALLAEPGKAAATAADVLIEHVVPQVANPAIRLSCEGPVISMTPVVADRGNVASAAGPVSGQNPKGQS